MFRYLVILTLALIIEACSTTKIVESPPMLLSPGIIVNQVESAIRAAINSYNGAWLVEEAYPGSIIAGLHVRNHYMKVEINYSEQGISSHIISSKNLKQDKNSIHKKALYWQNRLDASIKLEINKLSMPLGTGSKITEKTDSQTPGTANKDFISATGKEKQKEPGLKTQDQTAPETQEETGSQTPEQTILETAKEPASQTQEEIGPGTPDETNSKRTWKTYFEIQDEKARNIK